MTRIQSSVCVSMDSQKNTQLSSGHCTKSLVFLMIYLNGLNARWNSPASSGVGKADGWRHPPRQRHIGWTLKIRWNYCVFTSGRSLGWQELPRTEPPEMDHSHFIFTIFIQFRCDYIYHIQLWNMGISHCHVRWPNFDQGPHQAREQRPGIFLQSQHAKGPSAWPSPGPHAFQPTAISEQPSRSLEDSREWKTQVFSHNFQSCHVLNVCRGH